jgi:hypothetical protein
LGNFFQKVSQEKSGLPVVFFGKRQTSNLQSFLFFFLRFGRVISRHHGCCGDKLRDRIRRKKMHPSFWERILSLRKKRLENVRGFQGENPCWCSQRLDVTDFPHEF